MRIYVFFSEAFSTTEGGVIQHTHIAPLLNTSQTTLLAQCQPSGHILSISSSLKILPKFCLPPSTVLHLHVKSLLWKLIYDSHALPYIDGCRQRHTYQVGSTTYWGLRVSAIHSCNTAPPQSSCWPLSSAFLLFAPEDSNASCTRFWLPKSLPRNLDTGKFVLKWKLINIKTQSNCLHNTVFKLAIRFYSLLTAVKAVFSSSGLQNFINITPAINCSCTKITHPFWNFLNVPHSIFIEKPLHKCFPLSSWHAYKPGIWSHCLIPRLSYSFKSSSKFCHWNRGRSGFESIHTLALLLSPSTDCFSGI